MGKISSWDWEIGQKTVVESLSPLDGHEWQEEPYVSPDGETIAAIVKVGDGEFSIRTNNTVWEATFEKIWYPKFSPDGRLTAICQQDMEWALFADGESVGEATDYVWDTLISEDGSTFATMYKSMEQYGMCVNGEPWENLYENLSQPALSKDGAHTAGVAQVKSMAAADLEAFKSGAYSVVVDGKPWDNMYVNIWTPRFNDAGDKVAAQVRVTVYDNTIAVDDVPWTKTFNQVWEPVFNPKDDSVAAPAREGGKWGVAKDGAFIWEPRYIQCLELQYDASGDNLWAVVATSYGQFTACRNNAPWSETYPTANDLVVSPDGTRAGLLTSEYNENFKIVVDGTAWTGTYDMAWPVAFSADSKNVACMVEKDGKRRILVNGKAYERDFDQAWPPVFNEDGTKVLIRAIENNSYVRIVADVAQF
ncbi:electron transfer complex subunit TmcD [Pseudodesulfovibrio portus]|uniref:WD40 repeat domain-containing protein n=1 Tax=Pseudodesulfovibrio portus TaxID=231439 RepID=A0ABM8ATY8_9BACT|nr:WD40 repeat domain-containing protein [Pseudodesulfovibrio portus]BDQ34966.1 hypothetical protein JCM14722_25080 [Pseudodesulfovibrio portus]